VLRTTQNQKKFSRQSRVTGHYWVKWCHYGSHKDAVWRIGFYFAGFAHWALPGDIRTFTDSDFIEINENRIPRYWLFGTVTLWQLWVLIAVLAWNVGSISLDIYKLIINTTK